jgi:hypothetical protein
MSYAATTLYHKGECIDKITRSATYWKDNGRPYWTRIRKIVEKVEKNEYLCKISNNESKSKTT